MEVCIRNFLEMMSARGYNLCIDQRDYKVREEDDVMLQISFTDGENFTEAFFVKDIKLDKAFYNSVDTLAARLPDRNSFIFILDTSDPRIDETPRDSSKGYVLEIFSVNFFNFALSEMPFSCEYSRAPQEEVDELIEGYGSSHKFPIQYNTDRVVKWLGLEVGDILKITRASVSFPYFMRGDCKENIYVHDYLRVCEKI